MAKTIERVVDSRLQRRVSREQSMVLVGGDDDNPERLSSRWQAVTTKTTERAVDGRRQRRQSLDLCRCLPSTFSRDRLVMYVHYCMHTIAFPLYYRPVSCGCRSSACSAGIQFPCKRHGTEPNVHRFYDRYCTLYCMHSLAFPFNYHPVPCSSHSSACSASV